MSPAIGEMQLLGSGCCGRNECGERFRCGPLFGWPHFLPRRPAQPQGPYTSCSLIRCRVEDVAVSAGWVAAQVRSQSLASHCVGPAVAREIASAGSLDAALGILATSSYGERLHIGLNLATSEHEVFASVLWNLRVLAGWSPALGASRLRTLAGVFTL